jgi:hypothetical protein
MIGVIEVVLAEHSCILGLLKKLGHGILQQSLILGFRYG